MPTELLDLVLSEPTGIARSELHDNVVEWLIDNANAYAAVLSAIGRARDSIWISQLAFDGDCVSYGDAGTPVRLLDVLVTAAKHHGLDVRILLNESLLLDTATALRRALAGANATGIEVRGISRFPQLLHTKVLIVDGQEAIVLGSPFVNGYWDDASHRPTDVRRPLRELGGRPLHDLSVQLTGPVVSELGDAFEELWVDVAKRPQSDASPRARRDPAPLTPAATARVALTVPLRVLPGRAEGRTEILAAMEEGIAGARSLLYVEHQYLSSRVIVRALSAALAHSPALEVIVLLNQNPDVTAYRGWQNERLRESKLWDHPRVGFFTLWSAAARDQATLDVTQVFVHSKVIIADDEWATVGSANTDGVSLHSYGDDFSSRLGRRVFRDVRNFDANVVLFGDGGAMSASIGDLRRALWTEHLGEISDTRPAHGWLRHWRDRARENVAALTRFPSGTSSHGDGPFILPYSSAATPSAQLASLGVSTSPALDLQFTPSWLEVHCSPNWIRNMFT